MARKKLVECSFLIPIRRDRHLSDGRTHLVAAWEWLEENLAEFGGGTRDLSLHAGWYPDPDTGERVTDRSRRYGGNSACALARFAFGPPQRV